MADDQRPSPPDTLPKGDCRTMTKPTDMPEDAPDPVRHPTSGEPLSPAAVRALKEAEARRAAAAPARKPPETGGPDGPEPTRYGDWEKGGIVSDF